MTENVNQTDQSVQSVKANETTSAPKQQMLVVSDLYKSFKLPTEKASGLKQAVVNFFKGVKGFKKFEVLKGLDFVVEEGDFYGIVGRNGAGKSTLLKLISQIYTPDQGGVTVNGSLVPFIELGVGFNHDLTGRENIYLNGALLGFSEQEMNEMYDEIVEFSELEEFMHQKLKNYSSGMQVRLAFSIAIKADADILVLDEILAVGDEAFQRKCNDYFKSLKENHKTVILVTHSMGSVVEYCNKAILIDGGKIVASGDPQDVANQYSILNVEDKQRETGAVKKDGELYPEGRNEIIPELKLVPVSNTVLDVGDTLEFNVEFELSEPRDINVTFSMFGEFAQGSLMNNSTEEQHFKEGKHIVNYKYKLDNINPQLLSYRITFIDEKGILAYLPEQEAPSFYLQPDGSNQGHSALYKSGTWKID
jgi:ABC-2 type transport system ATP-binding protein